MSNSTLTVKEAMALLDVNEAADYLSVTVKVLQRWRERGVGPRYLKLGQRMHYYKKTDIDEWIDKGWVTPGLQEQPMMST